jgi:hypothetical protein
VEAKRQPRRSDRVRVVAYLTPVQVEALDRVASRHGLSRSETIAKIIDQAGRSADSPEPPWVAPEPQEASPSGPPAPPEPETPLSPAPLSRWEDDPDTLYPKAGCPRTVRRGVRCSTCGEVHRA